VEEVVIDQN